MKKPISLISLRDILQNQVLDDTTKQLILAYKNTAELRKAEEELPVLSWLISVGEPYSISDSLSHIYHGFEIPQIGQEFDILKIGLEVVVNIEIKDYSQDDTIPEELIKERVEDQLLKKLYYLSTLKKEVRCFAITRNALNQYTIYHYNSTKEGCGLAVMQLDTFLSSLSTFSSDWDADLTKLFSPSQYLASPLNRTADFLADKYFLTDQQRQIKQQIVELPDFGARIVTLTGEPGTGKTLLTYDLAKSYMVDGKKVHCLFAGITNQGHDALSASGWKITNVKSAITYLQTGTDVQILVVDEAQRLKRSQLDALVDYTKKQAATLILSYDPEQSISNEKGLDLKQELKSMESELIHKHYSLSQKVRSNPEIAGFIKAMLNQRNKNTELNYESVSLEYFEQWADAENYFKLLRQDGWKTLTYTSSNYNLDGVTPYKSLGENAHHVLGQEFDKVVVLMDEKFRYTEYGVLTVLGNQTYYSMKGMWYQQITRAIESLKIVVFSNPQLYSELVKIKFKN